MRIQKFADIDRSYSPVTDKCGHSGLQSLILRQLHGLFTDFFRRRGHPTPLVSCNQFFYYKRGNPQVRVDPDLYIVDNETRPVTEILNWKTWTREGKPPTLALELIDDEYPKTYADQLHARYERLGVRELLIYPEPDRSPNHVRFTHYLRDAAGRLVQQPCESDRVQSSAYNLSLVRQPDNTLRIATPSDELVLWPTAAEREAAAEARAAAAEARAAAEAAARAAAEARAGALEAELARLRGR